METHFFPLFVDLSKKEILVVGGGHVAQRRVQSLLPFARHITVVSPSVTKILEAALQKPGTRTALTAPDIQNMPDSSTVKAPDTPDTLKTADTAAAQDISDTFPFPGAPAASDNDSAWPLWLNRPFRDGDIEGMDLVLACTNNPDVNRQITKLARAAGIPANNCSDRNDCDFLFPGLSTRDSVTVGITAGGTDHALVKRIREQTEVMLDQMIPPGDNKS